MKIAYQYLMGLGQINHSGQLDSHIADYIAEYRGIDALRLIQLIVAADVIAGTNNRHSVSFRCSSRQSIIRNN